MRGSRLSSDQSQQHKQLQRDLGELSGGGNVRLQHNLRNDGRNDPWGDQNHSGNAPVTNQQHQRPQQDQPDLLGSGALSGLVVDPQLGDFRGGDGEAAAAPRGLLFKTFQLEQQQQQQRQQQQQQQLLLQQQQLQQGISRFGSGLDGLLGAAPPRDDPSFFD
ncbi:unnamed protein product [Pylaiella littoralis]